MQLSCHEITDNRRSGL